jgi:5-methylthioadenosine/S-adenosylhomocysteine deaminase
MNPLPKAAIHSRHAPHKPLSEFSVQELPMRLLCCLILLVSPLVAEQADWIWSARYVVTMDASRRIIENGAVAVRGERIVGAGPRSVIESRFQARQRISTPDAVISPGLVNAHTHAAMSLFRGIANDLNLQDWLNKYIFPAEAGNVDAGFVRLGTQLACLEMALGGTTTFTDMYYFEDAAAEAAKSAGMRGVLGETIVNFASPDAKTPQDALALAERFIARYKGDSLIVPAVAPHALYTNTDETLSAARAMANRLDVPLIIHVSETKQERDDALRDRGRSPVQVLDSLGVFDGRTVAAHCVWLDDTDIGVLSSKAAGVAHCPSSNMMLASGAAPIAKMLAARIAVGLGTDGPAGSNNDFSMFEEMDLAAKLQKLVTGNPQALSAAETLEMATLGGARALGLDREIGSLEPGKRADIIGVRLDAPHAVPLYGILSQMVYSLKTSDVQHVMVNGRWVVRAGRMLTLNQSKIMTEAGLYRRRIAASIK